MKIVSMQQNEETKPPLVKKEEPDATEPKQEKMETEEKKPEVKTEPKEEEDGGANGSSAASAAQNRKKGEKTRVASNLTGQWLNASSRRLAIRPFRFSFQARGAQASAHAHTGGPLQARSGITALQTACRPPAAVHSCKSYTCEDTCVTPQSQHCSLTVQTTFSTSTGLL